MNESNITPRLPESYNEGYPYKFKYSYWKEMAKINEENNKELQEYMNMVHHKIPSQVWKNSVCYSFMIDRDYGIAKKI